MEDNLEHIESRAQEMYDYQLDPAYIEDKLIELKDQSRQSNLRVDGVKPRPNETCKGCKNELDTPFQGKSRH